MNRSRQICARCVMDTSDPDIVFDENGICNHCHQYDHRARHELIPPDEKEERLGKLIEKIKRDGKGKEYDCILGVSGGADSSYAAYIAKTLGLRPLAIHFDNGWNSELAVDNIKNALSSLGIDLFTYVVDWDEFCDLQKSFLKASVPNAEIPTDHAINAVLWNAASQRNLRYIISGSNLETEGVMPLAWTYTALDLRHIKAIQKKLGSSSLRTFPQIGFLRFLYYVFIRHIRYINILNYVRYDKASATQILSEQCGWRPYPQKHYESVWTRFYQGVYLVEKFGYDKRKPHLSALVNSGQMKREEALALLDEPQQYDARLAAQDKEFVLKKFGFSVSEYERLLRAPVKQHADYPNLRMIYMNSSNLLKWFKNIIRS